MNVISDDELNVFTLASSLFVYPNEDNGADLKINNNPWRDSLKACVQMYLLDNTDDFSRVSKSQSGFATEYELLLKQPQEKEIEIARKTLFLPGLPLSALPVESLYKRWMTRGGDYGNARGMYGGDAAKHLESVFLFLGLKVPDAFSATPDHLSLILDLIVVLCEVGNETTACQIMRDHADWLEAYRIVLDDCAAKALQVPLCDDETRQMLYRGITFYSAFVVLLTEIMAKRMSQNRSSAAEEAATNVNEEN